MVKRLVFAYWLPLVAVAVTLPYLWAGPLTIWSIMEWLGLVAQAALLALAIRLHRNTRRATFGWLMWAFVALIIAQTSWFAFGFLSGFAGYDAEGSSKLWNWSRRVETLFELASFLLFAIALSRFLREHEPDATPTI